MINSEQQTANYFSARHLAQLNQNSADMEPGVGVCSEFFARAREVIGQTLWHSIER